MGLFSTIKRLFVAAPATETTSETEESSDWTQMAGTEGTGEYVVPFRSSAGRAGLRLLPSGRVRIRVEPSDEEAAVALAPSFPVGEWKQPSSQFRFSRVVSGGDAEATMDQVLEALFDATDDHEVEYNKVAGKAKWRSKIRAHKAWATPIVESSYGDYDSGYEPLPSLGW